MSIHLEEHVNHMRLKNWAYSLFKSSGVLFHQGFEVAVPTPAIVTVEKCFSPDIVAWSDIVTWILEVKSGKPNPEEDSKQAKEYLQIPKESLSIILGRPVNDVEVILLYLERNLKERGLVEALQSKIILETRIVIWSLDQRAGQVRLFYGEHGDPNLTSLLKARIPISLLPSRDIFVQPDSPLTLLAREVFCRLMERAYRTRDKKFSLSIVKEQLQGQVYAFNENEGNRKLRKAIRMGVRQGLCRIIDSDAWELNLAFKNPEPYLKRLNQFLQQQSLEHFF